VTDNADRILIIGAGLTGATMARTLAEAGMAVLVAEQGTRCGGHCHTYRHRETGIMMHAHGPHIFHSDDAEVWRFVERFADFVPYVHRVVARTGGQSFPLPINLQTLRQFFSQSFDASEARDHLWKLARHYDHAPRNFEEQARSTIGDQLYEAFFDGYTRKQWGLDPSELPASLFARLPVRFTADDSYYHHSRVAIPRQGYTALIERILAHPAIEIHLGLTATAATVRGFRHVVYTGPLDAWFDHRLGRLPYRTLDFEIHEAQGSFQGRAQVNYCDLTLPWTRITEHKYFMPQDDFDRTVYAVEYSRDCGPRDTPYYPVRLAREERLYGEYRQEAMRLSGISFVGRLATFRYIDMDVAISEARRAAHDLNAGLRSDRAPPAFFT
jgi:UDP-galactopyranose mutase